MDKLTPQLSEQDLKTNIDALVKQNAPKDVVQKYIDNYAQDANGNFVLKNAPKPDTTKNPDGTPKANNSLIGSEINFGHSIGDALYAGHAQKIVEKIGQDKADQALAVAKQIHADHLQGKDTTRLQKAYTDLTGTPVPEIGDIVPSINKTSKQVIGEGAGVLTDLLMGSGAFSPVVAGGALGATHGMQNNESTGTIALDTVVGAVAGKILDVGFQKAQPYLEKVIEKFGLPAFEKLAQHIPEGAQTALKDLAQKATDKLSIGAGTGGTDLINKTINEPVDKVIGKGTDLVKSGAEAITNKITGGIDTAQNALSRSNVPENFATSVDRLHAIPADVKTGVKESPLDLYNKYVDQAKKSVTDVKASTPIASIGKEDLGGAVDNVVAQRKSAGATMSSEMKKIGTIKTDLTEAFPKLQDELSNSGVTVTPKGKVVTSATSKITSQDAGLIQDYVGKLNKLGAKPSASELDAFLSRTPKELDIFKSKNNITGTTDAERIIKSNLKELSGKLSPEANPKFTKFADAKSTYAKLSGVLNDANGILGKKTASGGFSKDVGLLSSAVKSMVSGGKKDLLLKLEELTGKPLLDKTVVALQAMADAGNKEGQSLLQVLTSGKEHTAPDLLGRALDFTVKKGKKAIAGDPIKQTTRLIMEAMKK